jgi:hypothetical protein
MITQPTANSTATDNLQNRFVEGKLGLDSLVKAVSLEVMGHVLVDGSGDCLGGKRRAIQNHQPDTALQQDCQR